MKKKITHFRIFIVLALLSSCSTTSAVKKRASFELDCPEEKIEVSDLGGRSFGARGCGKKTVYLCTFPLLSPVVCLKNSENINQILNQRKKRKLYKSHH